MSPINEPVLTTIHPDSTVRTREPTPTTKSVPQLPFQHHFQLSLWANLLSQTGQPTHHPETTYHFYTPNFILWKIPNTSKSINYGTLMYPVPSFSNHQLVSHLWPWTVLKQSLNVPFHPQLFHISVLLLSCTPQLRHFPDIPFVFPNSIAFCKLSSDIISTELVP